jgi:hypothetical protein
MTPSGMGRRLLGESPARITTYGAIALDEMPLTTTMKGSTRLTLFTVHIATLNITDV